MFLAALVCIILGFVTAIFKVDILFPALDWFVAAIAFNTLTVVFPTWARRS